MKVGSRLEQVTALDRYHPASFDGKILQLHYARAQELAPYLDMAASQGEVYVQVWLKAEDAPVEITRGDDRQVNVIPDELKAHL